MKLLTVVGNRPHFIKLAPLLAKVDSVVVHTGQHYDPTMSGNFFTELGLKKPEYNLEVGSASHTVQIARVMERLEPILEQEAPDAVVVFGDTNSTLAGALAAAHQNIPVAHIEAGLRCGDMSVPEERNRVLTDAVSTWLFAPTREAAANLGPRGLFVGDILVEAFKAAMKRPSPEPAPKEPYYLLTLHREDVTRQDLDTIREQLDGHRVLFPCHPRTRKMARGFQELLPPLGHRHILELAKHARYVITDSGGLQREAYLLGTPCVTVRPVTEWNETVRLGWNWLTRPDEVRAAVSRKGRPRERPPIFGDGQTAKRILDVLSASIKTKETV